MYSAIEKSRQKINRKVKKSVYKQGTGQKNKQQTEAGE